MQTHYPVSIGGVRRNLPIIKTPKGIYIALFNIEGDWEFTQAAGQELAQRIPSDTEVLVMPSGKATPLLHVLGLIRRLPTIVVPKKKGYLKEPVQSVRYRSITTEAEQTLYIGADQVEAVRGKHCCLVDDVLSSGGTANAVQALLRREDVGAIINHCAFVFTEGPVPNKDVISLGHLPIFQESSVG